MTTSNYAVNTEGKVKVLNIFRENKISSIYTMLSDLENMVYTAGEYKYSEEIIETLHKAHELVSSIKEEDL